MKGFLIILFYSISQVVAFSYIVASIRITEFCSFHVPFKRSGMILYNTDALRIAYTHVVHRHQVSLKGLLTVLVRRFTFFLHCRSII